ncbi:MAG: thiamine phosphate synthase [Pseudolabrys sp.]
MASRPKQAEPRPAPRLYLLTPRLADTAAFAKELAAALAGADIAAVLLRLAEADERTLINYIKALAPIAQDNGAALLIDGHSELVARAGADGAHLSGLDAFTAGLEALKPDHIAGAGSLPSRHDVMTAAEGGADYILFGETAGRDLDAVAERVAWAAEVFELPCAAFAARLDEIEPLVAAGADFVALDCVWSDPRGAAKAIAEAAKRARLPEPAA